MDDEKYDEADKAEKTTFDKFIACLEKLNEQSLEIANRSYAIKIRIDDSECKKCDTDEEKGPKVSHAIVPTMGNTIDEIASRLDEIASNLDDISKHV